MPEAIDEVHARLAGISLNINGSQVNTSEEEIQYNHTLLQLCQDFVAEGIDSVRQVAGLKMVDMIADENPRRKRMKVQQWMNCVQATKEQVRQSLLIVLSSTNPTVRSAAVQTVAAFGAVDLSTHSWPALSPALSNNILSADVSDSVKVSSLEVIDKLSDLMSMQLYPDIVNQFLTIIFGGMISSRSDDVRSAAFSALSKFLIYAGANFEKENERNVLMSTLCEAIQSSHPSIRAYAYECCTKVAENYYSKLPPYMSAIYPLTIQAIQTDVDEVGTKAIEFWIAIAEKEKDIEADLDVDVEQSLNFIDNVSPVLIPVILNSLMKQVKVEDNDDSWNIAVAAGTFIDEAAAILQGKIEEMVIPFVTANILSSDWRAKEAAISAFGVSCTAELHWAERFLPIIVTALKDDYFEVRNTAAWATRRIWDSHDSNLTDEAAKMIIGGLFAALDDVKPKVVKQVCATLVTIASSFEETSDEGNNFLSQVIPTMIPKLLELSLRSDLERDFTIFEAMNKLVQSSARDMITPVILPLLTTALDRLEELATKPAISVETRGEKQSLLCALVAENVHRLSRMNPSYEQVRLYADRAIRTVLAVIDSADSSVAAREDAFIAISRVAELVANHNFLKYIPYVQASIIANLKNHEAIGVCTMAMQAFSECGRALRSAIAPFCDNVVRCLLELLQNPDIHPRVRHQVFSALADIALALDGQFERYNDVVFAALEQTTVMLIRDATEGEDMDETSIESNNSLRLSIIDVYTSIILCLGNMGKISAIAPAMNNIREFIIHVATSPNRSVEVLRNTILLCGDLIRFDGSAMRSLLQMPCMVQMVNEATQCDEIESDTMRWAIQSIQTLVRASR